MIGFPLLLIPFAIYNVIAFLMPFDWNTKLYAFRLPSGIVFEPTASDAPVHNGAIFRIVRVRQTASDDTDFDPS